MSEHYLNVNGTTLYCRVIGLGTPVLLLHGYGQSNRVFNDLANYLAKKHRVIMLDSRGHGRSGMGEKPFSIPLMAADAANVLGQLGIMRTAVIGFSDGGNIALQMAISHPKCVNAIVVISGNARPEGLTLYFRLFFKAWLLLLKALRCLNIMPNAPVAITDLLLRQPQISDMDMTNITVPTLLIFGSYDIVTKKHIAEMGRLVPGAKVIILKHTGHFTMVRRWRQYVDAVEEIILAHHLSI